MDPATIIGVLALALILFLAIRYIYKEKKRGTKCIGCPMAGSCEKFKALKAEDIPLHLEP